MGKQQKIKAHSMADVSVYQLNSITIAFTPRGPYVVFRTGAQVKVDDPSRFGSWETPHERHAYIRRFVEDLKE